MVLPAIPALAVPRVGTITIVIPPGHSAHTFRPLSDLGAGVDGHEAGDNDLIYTPANLKAMRSAGFGALTYRLRTELGIEAWHWNPIGTWSDAQHNCGYWTSSATSTKPILRCYGYRLPRRGSTIDQANNDGYSRLDDGDLTTFWKSNPYLDTHYTGEDNARHPQWIVITFPKPQRIDTLRIHWAMPYATRYRVEYWPDDDAKTIDDTFNTNNWTPFPNGNRIGLGGDEAIQLSSKPIMTRMVRLMMTASSEQAPTGSTDIRDSLGFALRELELGHTDIHGHFRDAIQHAPNNHHQTVTIASSTDPWHREIDKDLRVEQPGFDRIASSGLTNNQPLLTPVGVFYDTPENAKAELQYLKSREILIRQVEMGEEPDGQYLSPEDYGALYLQFDDQIHQANSTLELGGPAFQTFGTDNKAWPDAHGNGLWVNRLLAYLKQHHRAQDFRFLSFEWYPFDDISAPSFPQLLAAPQLMSDAFAHLYQEGLPHNTPILMTEYGYSAFAGQSEVDLSGALLNADIVGKFLTIGGSKVYLYGYEPDTLSCEEGSKDWGNLTLFLSDRERQIKAPVATYFAAQLLTQIWAQPGNALHEIALATTDISNNNGQNLVTAYATHRPDGRWAVMLINKDPKHTYRIRVQFRHLSAQSVTPFPTQCDLYQYSSRQYVWHPNGSRGYAKPNLPPLHTQIMASTIKLPPSSLSVLRTR